MRGSTRTLDHYGLRAAVSATDSYGAFARACDDSSVLPSSTIDTCPRDLSASILCIRKLHYPAVPHPRIRHVSYLSFDIRVVPLLPLFSFAFFFFFLK